MSVDRRELIRNEILFQCYGYRPQPRDADRMAKAARMEGEIPDATASDFAVECEYLAGKDLVVQERDPLAQGHVRWAITSAGIDHVESRGIA